MWCDSFNVVFLCRGFIRHAVGSFVMANPTEQSIRFHTMGPRHCHVSVELGDDFFASLSQRQRHVGITFLVHVKVTGVTQSVSAFGMTSRKFIPVRTAWETDLPITRAPSVHEGNWHSELQFSGTSFKLIQWRAVGSTSCHTG